MSYFWSIPPMWQGATCAVLASGPSMSKAVADMVHASSCKVIAVCRTVELAPWADMVYAADEVWWRSYRHQLRNFAGYKVSCGENAYPEVMKLRIGSMSGFNPDPGIICTGGNSGYQAVCVAVHAGCKRILLCGFDMHGLHWHPEYRSPMKTHGPEYLVKWTERFQTLKKPLEERGVEVLNCTPGSALKVWPYVALEDALLETQTAQ